MRFSGAAGLAWWLFWSFSGHANTQGPFPSKAACAKVGHALPGTSAVLR